MVMRIRERREAAGMTQQQLASKMGVLQSAVSNWELEISLPRVRQLPQLRAVLGCSSYDDLFLPQEQNSSLDQYTA